MKHNDNNGNISGTVLTHIMYIREKIDKIDGTLCKIGERVDEHDIKITETAARLVGHEATHKERDTTFGIIMTGIAALTAFIMNLMRGN